MSGIRFHFNGDGGINHETNGRGKPDKKKFIGERFTLLLARKGSIKMVNVKGKR